MFKPRCIQCLNQKQYCTFIKKVGVGRLMDYSIGRRQMSSVLCFTVYQTIYRINHLFQNGCALLKCRIFIPPTTGNPDVEKSRSHAPRYDTYVPIVNKHFKTVLNFSALFLCSGFVLSVLLS
jgi:hypothetical protein